MERYSAPWDYFADVKASRALCIGHRLRFQDSTANKACYNKWHPQEKSMQMKAMLTMSALVVAVVAAAGPTKAASPLTAVPVGSTAKYKVTIQTSGAKKRPKSTTHNVIFDRTSATSIQVRFDAKKGGTISVGADGNVTIPVNLQTALAPFDQIDALMRAAPSPLAAGNTWTAAVPVPVAGQSDNVSVTLKVTQLTENTLTVTGEGSNAMDITVGDNTRTANISVNATMSYGSNHALTSASGAATAIVPGGKKKGGGQFGSSWTITQF